MRNLKLVTTIKCNINSFDKNVQQVLPLTDSNHHEVYFRTDTDICLYNTHTNSLKKILAGSAKIVDWEYLQLNNEICVARNDGEVLVISLNKEETESVTFCEGGIERMSWSPDQEVIAFVTTYKLVVVMNCTYDPISETLLEDDTFGDQKFITVGWGKKETQFHGSEGKQAAKQKTDFVLPKDLSSFEQTPWLSWRGDGEYFAVSFLANYGRSFKVFNKEGQLQFTGEKLNDLGSVIAWKPSGSWIAAPHRLPNKYTIGLFEKNGLRHREITLPFKCEEEPVVNLCWSSDSDILAVETQKQNRSNVYLYTMGNYHWYLKQTLEFKCKVANIRWDSGINEQKTLHVMLEDLIYLVYRWTFDISTSIGDTVSNLAIVSVIDGNKLLLTDFRNNVIPPPMSKCILETSVNINAAGFINSPQCPERLFVLTADNQLLIYELEKEHNEETNVDRLKGVRLLKESSLLNDFSGVPLNFSHCLLLNDNHFVFCETNLNDSKVHLLNLETSATSSLAIPDQIVATTSTSQTSFLVHTMDASLLVIDVGEEKLIEPTLFARLPEACEHLQAKFTDGSIKLFALKDNQNLYSNDAKISSDVTSFFVGEHYLVYTQLTSMKFISLAKLPDTTVVSERGIERGGRLVTIVPKESRTVIQMPRGNLEAIQPRVLSLQIIGELLDKLQYEKSMLLIRKQRINLNIIFDHNPRKFLAETEDFLSQISNPQWLNLFLTELQNEDFTKTMYASNYEPNHASYPENFTIENKINFVCDHMCSVMTKSNEDKFILPIITCFVKKDKLESALDLIWSLKRNEAGSKADDALGYLLYMADINDLYNIALGMYDFDLLLFVANKSQKDPKEYIPFLNELAKLEENYRKFKIDDFLKRHDKAFENIANCGQSRFSECLEYVCKHNLYTTALKRFEGESGESYKQIAIKFGDYLRTNGKIEDASIMYERGGDFKQAIASAKHVLDLDRSLMLARSAKVSEEEFKKIAISLVPGLQTNSRIDDAYYLMKTYGDDFGRALSILLDGRKYSKAVFAAKMNAPELLESQVKPHLNSYSIELCSILEADKEKFLKYTNRLATVRSEKSKRAFDEDFVDESDLISETTSLASRYTGTSRSTGKTFRSSKNRRKHERKLLNLKEGNKFEDIALIDALYKLTINIFEQQSQISMISKALLEIRSDLNGRRVQKVYRDLLDTVKNKLDEIWIAEMMVSQPLLGPNIDYAQLQSDQHYTMLPPHQRFKPQLNAIDWEHAVLK